MHYLILDKIPKEEEINETLYFSDIKTLDFVMKKDADRGIASEVNFVGDIVDFNMFSDEIRDTLYEWTKNSYDCYLSTVIVEREEEDIDGGLLIKYSITGLESSFIVNFGEDYKEEGNTFNLLLRQQKGTNIGIINTSSEELDNLSQNDFASLSGFKFITLDKLKDPLLLKLEEHISKIKPQKTQSDNNG